MLVNIQEKLKYKIQNTKNIPLLDDPKQPLGQHYKT